MNNRPLDSSKRTSDTARPMNVAQPQETSRGVRQQSGESTIARGLAQVPQVSDNSYTRLMRLLNLSDTAITLQEGMDIISQIKNQLSKQEAVEALARTDKLSSKDRLAFIQKIENTSVKLGLLEEMLKTDLDLDQDLIHQAQQLLQRELKKIINDQSQSRDVKYTAAQKLLDPEKQVKAFCSIFQSEIDRLEPHIKVEIGYECLTKLFEKLSTVSTEVKDDIVFSLVKNDRMDEWSLCKNLIPQIANDTKRDEAYCILALNSKGDGERSLDALNAIVNEDKRKEGLFEFALNDKFAENWRKDAADSLTEDKKQQVLLNIATNYKDITLYNIMSKIKTYNEISDKEQYPHVVKTILKTFFDNYQNNPRHNLEHLFRELTETVLRTANPEEQNIILLGFAKNVQYIMPMMPSAYKKQLIHELLMPLYELTFDPDMKQKFVHAILKNPNCYKEIYEVVLEKHVPIDTISNEALEDLISQIFNTNSCSQALYETALGLYMPLDSISLENKRALIESIIFSPVPYEAIPEENTHGLSQAFREQVIQTYIQDENEKQDLLAALAAFNPQDKRFKTTKIASSQK